MPKSIPKADRSSTIEHLLDALGNSLTDALVWASADRIVRGCNKAGIDILGYEREELLGKNLLDILPAGLPEEFSLLDAALGRLLGQFRK